MSQETESLEGALILGIDLGTTKSAVTAWDPEAGKVEIFRNAEGKTITPSVVAWDRERGRWVVGEAARQMSTICPGDVVHSIKRCIGRWYKDPNVAAVLPDLAYRLVPGSGKSQLEDVLVDFDGENAPEPPQVSAPAISAQVLKQLRIDAAARLGREVEEVKYAVVTVPAYFDALQREATRLAGELAGLTVVDILNEPTAAALAYGAAYGDDVIGPDWRNILVYDLGGGTFDISILEARRFGAGYQVLTRGVDGDTRLGGDDIDASVVRWLVDEIGRRYTRSVRPTDYHARACLRLAAERAKVLLSTETEVTVDLPALALDDGLPPLDVHVPLSREQLERCAADVLQRARDITQHAVERVEGLSWTQIDQIILVGGQTLMPAVQRSVERLAGRPPRVLKWPQEAIARGAGEHAHAKGMGFDEMREHLLRHVVALPLGMRVQKNTFATVVPANATLPHRSAPVPVTTDEDNQTHITVEVLQQPRGALTADECTLLGSLQMEVPPLPRGVPDFHVRFDVQDDGTVRVDVIDMQRRKTEGIEILGERVVYWRAEAPEGEA